MPEINIEENKGKIIELLDVVHIHENGNIIDARLRNEVIQLKKYLDESDFYTAPASTMFHLHVKGGLAQHSLNVYYTLCDLCKQMGIEMPKRTKIITTILHDVNKIDYYKDNILNNGKISPAKPYTTNDTFPIGHGEKSVIMLQRYLTLTEEEIMMIRWHWGLFDRAYMQYKDKIEAVCPNAILLITADWLTTVFVDPTYEPSSKHSLASVFDKTDKEVK